MRRKAMRNEIATSRTLDSASLYRVYALDIHSFVIPCNRPARGTGCCERIFWAVVKKMGVNGMKMIAIAIIVAGVLSLAYGGFSYTKDTTAVKLGPIELSVKETKTVNIPLWAGIGAILVGGLLLVFGNKK